MKNSSSHTKLVNAYRDLLLAMEEMGHHVSGDPNFRGTAERAATAFSEMVLTPKQVNREVARLFTGGFPATPQARPGHETPGGAEAEQTSHYKESGNHPTETGNTEGGEAPGMVICANTIGYGLCPHHLLPVIYKISLGYLPDQKIVGISKLARAARLFAAQPMLQETMTCTLAQTIMDHLDARGAAVSVRGFHLCMAARGARCHESAIFTSSYRGLFKEDSSLKTEFLSHIHSAREI